VNSVNEVLETDPVIASFINQYFQQFLENDQALKKFIEKKPDKIELPNVALSGSYNDLTDKPTIPNGKAADYDVANNDTTTVPGYLADARIVKVHGDEIDELADKYFLEKYELENKDTVISENASGGKQVVETTSDAVVTTLFTENTETGVKTITSTIVPTSGSYNYIKTTTITETSNGKTIKEKYVKEEK
jgi:hypothetical protein